MNGMKRLVLKADAGTGKTYNLEKFYLGCLGCDVEEAYRMPVDACRPEEIIAVTFTRKAAAELKDRIRRALCEQRRYDEADRVNGSFIGTVHGVCLRLLQEYALEAGISPAAEELAEEDERALFNKAIAPLLEKYAYLGALYSQFRLEGGFSTKKKRKHSDPAFLATCRELIALARVNGKEDNLRAMGNLSTEKILNLIRKLSPVVSDDKSELSDMKRELSEARAVQMKEENYDRSGKLTAEEKKAGVKKLSGKEKAHLEFMKALPVDAMRWKDWLSIINRPAGAKDHRLQQYVEQLNELGRRVFGLEKFEHDVRDLIQGTFQFAAEATEAFRAVKESAGLVDFADMERMACDALSEKAVKDRLKGRFRVLFVDEFQDTSPIQLRIFQLICDILQSGSCNCLVVFAGDDKQSVYGFRGADSALTRAGTPEPLWEKRSLSVCRRSLPAICRFVEAFFSHMPASFRENLLGAPDARLNTTSLLEQPGRESLRAALESSIPSLHFWLFDHSDKRKKAKTIAALAESIAGMIDNPAFTVACTKDFGSSATSDTRKVQAGDIAVLCRTNEECVELADALEALGVSACAERRGLLEQQDVRFCLNALRLTLYPDDILSAACLFRSLHEGDDWFDAAENGRLADGIPLLTELEGIRERLALLSPAELLDEVMNATDAFRRAAARPRGRTCMAELEALRALAREYEDAMHGRHAPATAQGWLDWLEEEERSRASGGEDAVQVWTYHKSKGLERNVVVLYGLSGKKPAGDIWKPRAFSQTQTDDPVAAALRTPLENRTLEWLPNVFGGASALDPVCDTLASARAKADRRQQEETLRLLYVGMTRARNVLVLTADFNQQKNAILLSWLAPFLTDEALRSDLDAMAAAAAPGMEVEASLLGSTFHVRCINADEAADRVGRSMNTAQEDCLFPPRPVPAEMSAPEQRDAPRGRWLPALKGRAVDTSGIAPGVSRKQLGNMVHGWFAVCFGMSDEQRLEEERSGRMDKRLEHLCTLWNSPVPLWNHAESPLKSMSEALRDVVNEWFESRADKDPGDRLVIRTEWPLEERRMEPAREGTRFRTESMRLDMLAEVVHGDGTAGPCLAIDHKCGDYEQFTDEKLKEHLIEEYGARQTDYVRALRAMGRVCRCWLHLPLEGRVLEILANDKESSAWRS